MQCQIFTRFLFADDGVVIHENLEWMTDSSRPSLVVIYYFRLRNSLGFFSFGIVAGQQTCSVALVAMV